MAKFVKYFAYGSNLYLPRLRARTPSCHPFAVTHLSGYKLCFHKRGQDGSGKCNAWFTGNPTDHVMGVVYTLTLHDKQRLDQAEGLGQGYDEITLRVFIAGNEHTIFLYVANLNHIDNSLKPFTWYKDLVMAGCHAHQFPNTYKTQQVAPVDAIPDPDQTRTHAHLEILTTNLD